MVKIDKYLASLSKEERIKTEKELLNMLAILAAIVSSDRSVAPVIHEMTPSFKKIILTAYECFSELGR